MNLNQPTRKIEIKTTSRLMRRTVSDFQTEQGLKTRKNKHGYLLKRPHVGAKATFSARRRMEWMLSILKKFQNRITKIGLYAALLALVAPTTAAAAAASTEIRFASSSAHAFSGFGVQIWPSTLNALTRRQVLQSLNVRVVRLGTYAKLPPGALRSGESITDILAAIQAANATAKETRSAKLLADELNALNISVDAVVWQMPSSMAKERRWRDQHGNEQIARFASPDRIEDYANFITAQLQYALQLGFHIHFVELANEPDGNWATQWDPSQYAHLVGVTRQTLNANGLSGIGIEGPGTGTERVAAPFIAALVDGGEIRNMAAISVHDWDSRKQADPEGLIAAFRSAMSSVPPSLPLRVTEYNDENPRWSEAPYLAGPALRNKTPNSADTPEFGLAIAASVLKLYAQGAQMVILWQVQDLPWQPNSLGLIDLNGHLRPAAQALSSFLPIVQPGSIVFEGTSSDPELVSAAFVGPSTTLISVANLGDHAIYVRAVLPLGLTNQKIAAQRTYTVARDSAQTEAQATASSQGVALDVPAHSLTTVELR